MKKLIFFLYLLLNFMILDCGSYVYMTRKFVAESDSTAKTYRFTINEWQIYVDLFAYDNARNDHLLYRLKSDPENYYDYTLRFHYSTIDSIDSLLPVADRHDLLLDSAIVEYADTSFVFHIHESYNDNKANYRIDEEGKYVDYVFDFRYFDMGYIPPTTKFAQVTLKGEMRNQSEGEKGIKHTVLLKFVDLRSTSPKWINDLLDGQ